MHNSLNAILWGLLAVFLLFSSGCQEKPVLRDVAVTVVPLEQAWVPSPRPPLCPQPKDLKAGNGRGLTVAKEMTVRCPVPGFTEHLQSALKVELRETDGEVAEFDLEIDPESTPPHPGGYSVKIDDGKVWLKGYDEAGLFYAIQTLAQLSENGQLPALEIRDWPSFPVRGVMLHTGADSGPTHRRLIKRVLAPLKLNVLLVECEYAKWESHPELWVPALSIPKEQLAETVKTAREYLLEPIPLVQTLTHMQWLFVNEQNPDLRENSVGYSLPPDEERGWTIILDIYQEALEVFKPRYLHIGFDEVRGSFPGTKTPATEVIVTHAERLRLWLEERGVKTIMWGDMLLHLSEAGSIGLSPTLETAAYVREQLSREILIMDWQYEVEGLEFPEVEILTNEGFSVTTAPWYHWPTALAHAKALAAVSTGGLGVVQTTWPGRVLNDRVVEGNEYHQFATFVVTAEAAWNGGEVTPQDPERLFNWLWRGRPDPTPVTPGFALRLEGGTVELQGLPTEPTILKEVGFVPGKGLPLKQGLAIEVGKSAGQLGFLWVTEKEGTPGQKVGQLEVVFEDGGIERAPIRLRKEIDAPLSDLPAYRAPVAWTDGEGKHHLRRWLWTNPDPKRQVAQVKLLREPGSPDCILHGLTVVTPR